MNLSPFHHDVFVTLYDLNNGKVNWGLQVYFRYSLNITKYGILKSVISSLANYSDWVSVLISFIWGQLIKAILQPNQILS